MVIGQEAFETAVRTHFAAIWAAARPGMPIYPYDPGADGPSGEHLILEFLPAVRLLLTPSLPANQQLYRQEGRIQGMVRLPIGTGPKRAAQHGDLWFRGGIWSPSFAAGVFFYDPSPASERGNDGAFSNWTMDVRYRYDELPA